jgi:peptidoglycan hydrolase-like protein with peptidoglycan-binding domain
VSRRLRRAARTAGVVAVGGAVVAAAAGVAMAVAARPDSGGPSNAPVPVGSAAVTRGTVIARVQVGGTLGYDGTYPILNQLPPGILTATAAQGSVVDRGGILYRLANQPVRLLLGGTPAYRDFAAGMPDGPDVAELEANLAALGMNPGQVDEHFTASTTAAIRRWQAAQGVPAAQRTGTVPMGAVVFLPGPVRVGQVSATVGAQVGPGEPVLSGTSTSRVVTATVTTEQQALVHAGDQVLVVLPGNAGQATGTVVRVGSVATAPTQQGGGGGGGGGQQQGSAGIPVTIAVTLPAGAASLDQAPVQVGITTARHADVLLVPVTALLARPGGGYQVRLPDGRFVAVQPGLYDDSAGTVEVTGELTPGDQVEVPSS